MISALGTPAHPLRVAIIGSGPSAFYAAGHLFKKLQDGVEVDMLERLPTPFGLVRDGVAPDHPKIKSVTRAYLRTASHANFRFYGNITFGTDIHHADILNHYHAVIYAVGAQTDRDLNIPGIDLPGSHAATAFVAWYNGHPDYRDLEFDLSQESAAVIGVGNVAMDVARILARTHDELFLTDMAGHALDALANSNIRTIYIIGRRGPIQAKFTNPELKELGELTGADVIVDPDELELDPASRHYLLTSGDRTAERNYQTLQLYQEHELEGHPKRVILKFLASPAELIGTDHVEAMKLVKNELYEREDGTLHARATAEYETLPVGLVFRSIGYHGVPLPGVPFDEWHGVLANDQGCVTDHDGQTMRGEYAVGWFKRGPSGTIGTNKPDAQESVNMLLQDLDTGHLHDPVQPTREDMEAMLHSRGIRFVTFEEWRALNQLEIARGAAIGRPRVKFTRVEDMLAALDQHQSEPV